MSEAGDLFGDDVSAHESSVHMDEDRTAVEEDVLQDSHQEFGKRVATLAVAFPDPNVLPLNQILATMKLPSSITIAEKEYTPGDEIGQDSSVHVIRWRYKRDGSGNIVNNVNTGKPDYESNSRIVRWTDGSTSLVVNDVYFDVQNSSDRVHLFTSVGGDDPNYEHSSAPQELAGVVNSRLVIRRVQTAEDVEAASKNLKNTRAQRAVMVTSVKAGNTMSKSLETYEGYKPAAARSHNLSVDDLDHDDREDLF